MLAGGRGGELDRERQLLLVVLRRVAGMAEV